MLCIKVLRLYLSLLHRVSYSSLPAQYTLTVKDINGMDKLFIKQLQIQ